MRRPAMLFLLALGLALLGMARPASAGTATVVGLESATNPSLFGQSVEFTATVTPAGATGTVTFSAGGVVLGTGELDGGGQATFATSALPVGTHSMAAAYEGDLTFDPSDSSLTPLSQVISAAATTTTVVSSQNPSVLGGSVTFTATVAGPGGTPGGSVTFMDGAATLGTDTLNGAGQAAYSTAGLSAGTHSITVVYAGAGNYAGSTSGVLSQLVKRPSTTTVGATVNPSVLGQSVSFTVTVTGGGVTPTGTVQFNAGGSPLGAPVALVGGSASSPAIDSLAVGTHVVTASYSGDGNYSASSGTLAGGQVVNKAGTTTGLGTSGSPSTYSQSVTFTATVAAAAPGAGTPGGTVTFKDGEAEIGTGALAGGTATFTTDALAAGAHTITAVYAGDGDFNGSTSGGVTQTVNVASSTTGLASSANPAAFGQSVLFTATVPAMATGTVTFKNGTNTLGTGAVAAGSATYTTTALGVGSHSITATYGGDANYTASTSGAVTQVVNKADTTTTVESSLNPSTYGLSVTFTATVSAAAPAGGTPAGTVTFKDGATVLGTGTLNPAGQATLASTALSGGARSITAVYGGSANYNGSTSGVFLQNVNPAESTTSLAVSPATSVFGESVALTATVPVGATGSVTFKDGLATLGTATVDSAGHATLRTTALTVGTHADLTAEYAGDGNYAASTSATATATVNKADTTTGVNTSVNPSTYGANVTFTATVAAVAPGAGTPTGTVTFRSDGAEVGTEALAGGVASLTVNDLPAGTHDITAEYSGDAGFNVSSNAGNALTQDVGVGTSTTAVVTSGTPTTYGQSITFTATVTPSSATGMVTFKSGGTTLGTVALAGGEAALTTTTLAGGTHSITAVYAGDGNVTGSTSPVLTQTVNKADTTTGVVANPSPSVFSNNVTFTATVAVVAPGAGTPAGTVTFKDGAVEIGTGTLNGGGVATFTTNELTAATHTITAVYAGNGNYNTSSGTVITQVVDKSATTTALSSTPNPSDFGQSVTFTATVTAGATGNVTFKDGLTTLGTVALDGTTAELEITSLTAGSHSITAEYAGDSNFVGSTSAPVTQTVNAAETMTTCVATSANPSIYGQTVNFLVTVQVVPPGVGTPQGMVTLKDGAAVIGTVALDGSGQAAFSTDALSAGNHNIVAEYAGNANFQGSDNAASVLIQVVRVANSTVTLSTTGTPSVFGQSVTITAALSPTGATGTVTFMDGNTVLGTALIAAGEATFTTTGFAVGSHILTAIYAGDVNCRASTSTPFTQVVNRAATTTTVDVSANPTVYGETVTFTITVTVNGPGAGTAAGTVTIKDGVATLGTALLNGLGQATFSTDTLGAGAHTITVVYEGNANFSTSTSSAFVQTVNPGPTTITLTSSKNPSALGDSVTFTATLPAGATGTVTFLDGVVTLGTGNIDAAGNATFSTAGLALGSHPITAVYAGDANYGGSTSAILTQVVAASDTPPVVSSTQSVTRFGQSVTFTATVTAGATGTVTFKDGATTLGTGVLDGANPSRATFAISSLAVGSHSITAEYDADGAGGAPPAVSAPIAHTVIKTDTTTALVSSENPAAYGTNVTFTATVTAVAPGAGTPAGTVTFRDGTTVLGTDDLDGAGVATLTVGNLPPASHSITAEYEGNASYNTSASTAVSQTVEHAPTTASVATSKTPSVVGEPVTFTATVLPAGVTGLVTFRNGVAILGTSRLDDTGHATFTTSALAVGTHSITATYEGDDNFEASDTSEPVDQVVNQATTITGIAQSSNPTVYGQSVTFTATVEMVAPATGTPTGTVTFKEGATVLGTGTLDGDGNATFATAALIAGVHLVTAVYEGTVNLAGSTSAPVSHTVLKVATVVTMLSAPQPSVWGQSVTLTATVTPASATGTITFKEGAAVVGTGVVAGGEATFTTSALTVGLHPLTARYPGDDNHGASNSTPAWEHTVNKADTTTAVVTSDGDTTYGESVTFTATVAGVAPGAGTPTGTVTFKIGTTVLGTGTLNGSAQATLTRTNIDVGSHTVTAEYGGDTHFNGSSGTTGQTVSQATSTITLAIAPEPSVWGQNVTFTATVPSAATGTVTFKKGAATLGTGTISSGQATYSTTTLEVGLHTPITAEYPGDTNFTASVSAEGSHQVNQAPTATVLVQNANPTTYGQPVTFTATVSVVAPGAGTLTGTVQFKVGGVNVGVPTALDGSRRAAYTTSALTVGAHTVTAVYDEDGADGHFLASTSNSLVHTVNIAPSTTTLITSKTPTVFGEPMVFTATVPVGATGTVTFKDGATILGTGAVNPVTGQATFDAATLGTPLAVGNHNITAVYGGSANYAGSTSNIVVQRVNKANTTTVVVSSLNPSQFHDNVTFTATVAVVAPGAGSPTGTVTFMSGTTGLGTGAVNPATGVATFSTSALAVGDHPVTAVYGGDGSFNGSSGNLPTQTVAKADGTTTLVQSVATTVWGQSVTFTATVPAGATGTVTFKEGLTTLGTRTVAGDQAALSTSTLSVGSHDITAEYSGDDDFSAGTSNTVTHVVEKADTTTVVVSSVTPSTFGQSVSFTATVAAVAPGAGAPTGNVQFQIDGSDHGTPVALVSGTATSTAISSLAVGDHTVTANYLGDGNFNVSNGSLPTQTVGRATPAVAVASTQDPSVWGQSVSFTATVTGPGGTPTGTVQFTVDGVNFGDPVALVAGSATSDATTLLEVGNRVVRAVYSGDGSYEPATGLLGTLADSQTVNKANTTTTVVTSGTPSDYNSGVIFTATVAAVAPGAGTPTGTVTFKDGATTLGTGTLNGSGQATYTTTALSGGVHNINAEYGGDTHFNTSAGNTEQRVNKIAPAGIVLIQSLATTVWGQNVTFTATVTGAGATPTGNVTFWNGATNLGTVALNGSGVAARTRSDLAVGTHPNITAVYAGNVNYNALTSSAISHEVIKADTTTAVVSSVNPSMYGQNVTFTATVTAVAPGAGTPTGTVTFLDGGVSMGTGTLNVSRQATFTISTLALGSHGITVQYAGDGNFNGSGGALPTQVVNKANTTTTVTSSHNPSVWGESITFGATVATAAVPGLGTPSGTVQFRVGGADFGPPVTLDGAGHATSQATTTLEVGGHPVTAVYSGDTLFNTSTGSLPTQTVNKANTTTAVVTAPNPSIYTNSVTLTATVTPVAPGAGMPTGTVTFYDDAALLGTGTLDGAGQATFSTSALLGGDHAISAVYGSDAHFNGSTGATTHTVSPTSASTTVVVSSLNPSVFGQSVTFTATVSGAGVTPTGTVNFYRDGILMGPGTLNGLGVATYSTAGLARGDRAITAVYQGDDNYETSTGSLPTQVVLKANTTTVVIASANPTPTGQNVTLTATVAPVAPGAGVPSGTVQFYDGLALLGTGTLNGGSPDVATFTTSALTRGVHTIKAVYLGDDSFNGSDNTTALLSLTVDQRPVANNDTYAMNSNMSLTAATVLTNDTDGDGDALTATLVAGPAKGVLAFNANGTFTYTPFVNFAGTDTFTYKVSDGLLESNTATVTITVTACGGAAPVASNDSYVAVAGTPLNVAASGVLTNDRCAEAGALTSVLVRGLLPASAGSLTFNANGSFLFTPAPAFTGTVTFTYKARTGANVDSNVATVTITVATAKANTSASGQVRCPVGSYTPYAGTGNATYYWLGRTTNGVFAAFVTLNWKVAGLSFAATTCTATIVGSYVTLEGQGKVGAVTGYRYLVKAVDGVPDKVRFRIWNAANALVFDNERTNSDPGEWPQLPVASGNVLTF